MKMGGWKCLKWEVSGQNGTVGISVFTRYSITNLLMGLCHSRPVFVFLWGHILIWPKWVSATKQGVVFRVLSLNQGTQFHCLAS